MLLHCNSLKLISKSKRKRYKHTHSAELCFVKQTAADREGRRCACRRSPFIERLLEVRGEKRSNHGNHGRIHDQERAGSQGWFIWLQLRASFCYFVAHNVDCSAPPPLQNWLQRWFVLTGPVLTYFADKGGKKKGEVCVRARAYVTRSAVHTHLRSLATQMNVTNASIEPLNDSVKPNGIEIAAADRVLYLCCSTGPICDAWMQALRRASADGNNTSSSSAGAGVSGRASSTDRASVASTATAGGGDMFNSIPSVVVITGKAEVGCELTLRARPPDVSKLVLSWFRVPRGDVVTNGSTDASSVLKVQQDRGGSPHTYGGILSKVHSHVHHHHHHPLCCRST